MAAAGALLEVVVGMQQLAMSCPAWQGGQSAGVCGGERGTAGQTRQGLQPSAGPGPVPAAHTPAGWYSAVSFGFIHCCMYALPCPAIPLSGGKALPTCLPTVTHPPCLPLGMPIFLAAFLSYRPRAPRTSPAQQCKTSMRKDGGKCSATPTGPCGPHPAQQGAGCLLHFASCRRTCGEHAIVQLVP